MDTVMTSLSNMFFVKINTFFTFPELDFIMSTVCEHALGLIQHTGKEMASMAGVYPLTYFT